MGPPHPAIGHPWTVETCAGAYPSNDAKAAGKAGGLRQAYRRCRKECATRANPSPCDWSRALAKQRPGPGLVAGGRAGCAPQEGEQAAPWAGSPRARAAQAVTATRSGQAAPSRCPGRRTPAIAGMTHQEILEELPYLREEDILACLSYATDQEAQS